VKRGAPSGLALDMRASQQQQQQPKTERCARLSVRHSAVYSACTSSRTRKICRPSADMLCGRPSEL